MQDRWAGTHPQFMTGSWIEKAKQMLPAADDKLMAERNARMQITYWGNNDPKTILHEYAAKEWNGILKSLYNERWQLFFTWAKKRINGINEPYPSFFEIENSWVAATSSFSTIPMESAVSLLPSITMAVDMNIRSDEWAVPDFYNEKK